MENNDQKFLSHFGVPGMKWGQRRSAAAVTGIMKAQENKFKDYANKKSGQAAVAGTKAKLGDTKAGDRIEKHKAAAKQNVTMARGVSKAQKMVEGMNMKQAIKTLESAAGYKTGSKVAAALMYNPANRLALASNVYAYKTNIGGGITDD